MNLSRSISLVLLPAVLAIAACQGPNADPAPAPSATAGAPPAAVREPATELQRREAARAVASLEARLAVDRLAVQEGEQRLASLRSLHAAGRVTDMELNSAETEVLGLRRDLLRRERELAAARQVVGEPSQRAPR